jgi:uncharacterized membrane protein
VSDEGGAPTWVMAASGLLALGGLGISIYLTIAHFVGTQILACVEHGTINCAVVTTSPQSYFLHIPVAILGLVQYGAMTALCSPWAWRSRARLVHVARVVMASVGMAFVLWLVAAELLLIGHICLWCTGVHVITFALLIVVSRVPLAALGSVVEQ